MISQKRKDYLKNYYLIHKDKIKNQQKQYRKNNHDSIYARMKIYRDNLEVKARIIEVMRNYRKSSLNVRLGINLRNRVNQALNNNYKSIHTLELLGCSVEFLKKHLESKFTEGMNWNNYGKRGWVIDHRLPCCSFDLRKEEEQRKCFHYTNLQPLWSYDNIAKVVNDKQLKCKF